MKKFKKVCGLFLALALTSCTNINTQGVFNGANKNTGELVEIRNLENEVSPEITKIEKTEEQVLTSFSVKSYLDEIKNRLRNSQKKEISEVKNSYKVLVGEYLVLDLNGEQKVKVDSSPKNTNPRVKISNNKLYFRTIYRGNYILNLYTDNFLTRKINVHVISKNNFSEDNIYDIIVENSSENNKILKDAITLYKIYYPNGKYYKNVNFQLLKYGYENKDNQIMNEALNILKSDISSFEDDDKKLILESATLTKQKIFIPQSLYEINNPELQKTLAEYIKSKDIMDKKDVNFLKNNFPEILDEINGKKDEVIEEIGSTVDKGNEFLGQVKEKITNTKPKIKDYKKELSREKSKDKKADIYYNLMKQYVKSGNRIKALRYLSLIKQSSTDKDLIRKAEAEVNAMR